jgi:ubiquinone/menaquinone biosynthesis C-methylase UbiE
VKASIQDWISLFVLKLAKTHRKKYVVGQDNQFYNEFFKRSDPEACSTDVRRTLRNMEILSTLNGCYAGHIIVDIGCGVGDLCRILPVSLKRIGIDLSLPALRYANRDCRTDAMFVNASLYELPIQDESVDTVICLEVLEHLREDNKALEEIRRILRSGGRLIISLPSEVYFPQYLDLMGHWRHYTPEVMTQMLERVGLKPERTLRRYRRFNKWYFYLYLMLWIVAACSRGLTRRAVTLYNMRLPFDRKSIYQRLERPLLWIAHSGFFLEDAETSSGTFMVAVRTTCQAPDEAATDIQTVEKD